MTVSRTYLALTAAALIAVPSAGLAQSEVTDQANEVAEQANRLAAEAEALSNTTAEANGPGAREDGARDARENGDDDDFPWGLLGLLGLAGLLGLKRRDNDHIRHDHRSMGGGMGGRTGTRSDTDTRL